MTKDKALKLSLEALEDLQSLDSQDVWLDRWSEAITAIKEALAQPVQPEDLHIWKARALQAEAVIEKFMATPPLPVQPATDK